MVQTIKNPAFRRWAYGIAASILVLLGGYGILSEGEITNYTNLVEAVLVAGGGVLFMAERNTPSSKGKHANVNDEA